MDELHRVFVDDLHLLKRRPQVPAHSGDFGRALRSARLAGVLAGGAYGVSSPGNASALDAQPFDHRAVAARFVFDARAQIFARARQGRE